MEGTCSAGPNVNLHVGSRKTTTPNCYYNPRQARLLPGVLENYSDSKVFQLDNYLKRPSLKFLDSLLQEIYFENA